MSRASRRSNRYRSFITCDDPKGVVECGTIIVSKFSPQKREHNKFDDQRKQKDSDTSLAEKEEKNDMGVRGITGEVHSPTSFQLMQVSIGAQKLNHVINSWSNELSDDERRPKDVAKDLLKGAVDLGESLVMLSRLQEDSNYTSGLINNQKQKLEEGEVHDMGMGIMNLNEFRDQTYHTRFQKPRLSVDGPSRNSFGELKKVIRGSLIRQNLAPDPAAEEAYDHRRLHSPDKPSTSSSLSTMDHSTNFPSSESSISSTASQKKSKKLNLIARLMGLESLPSSPRKQMGSKKCFSMMKPVFEIDLPKTKKPQISTHKADTKGRILDDILETRKSKRLLEEKSVSGMNPNSDLPKIFHSNETWIDDKHPIVSVKPQRFASVSLGEPVIPKYWADGALDTKEILVKCGSSNSTEKRREVKANRSSIKNLLQEGAHFKEVREKPKGTQVKAKEKGSSIAFDHVYQKPQKKQIAEKKATDVQKAADSRRNKEEKETVDSEYPLKSRDQANAANSKLQNPKDLVNIVNSKISKQQSTNSKLISKDKTQRASNGCYLKGIRQGNEKRELKKPASTGDQGCRHENKEIYGTYENKSISPAAETLLTQELPGDRVDASQVQIIDYDDNNLGGFPGENTILMTTHRQDLEDHQNDNQSSLCEIFMTIHESEIADHSSTDTHSLLYETPLPAKNEDKTSSAANKNEDGFKSTAEVEANCRNVDHLTPIQGLTATEKLQALLLSSPSFVSLAEELFDLKANPDMKLPATDEEESCAVNSRIILDCANELMELKSSQYENGCVLLLQISRMNLKSCISLDQLLEEICDGVEALRHDYGLACETHLTDGFSGLLDRDLRSAGMANGTWNFGWRNTFSVVELDQIVSDIEKLVLAQLIKEVLADFCFNAPFLSPFSEVV